MNEQLFRTLLKKYEAVIEDCMYKIQSLSENNIIIPEHVDITCLLYTSPSPRDS